MTQPADLRIGQADALVKLEWSTRTTDIRAWFLERPSLAAVRNEVVGLQVLLQASEPFTLTVGPANWIAPLGFEPRVRLQVDLAGLPAEAVEVFPVGYLEDDDRRWRSEYLDRADHIQVPANRPQAAYVRIAVPKSLAAGSYTGQIKAYGQFGFGDEELAWRGDFTLLVAEATLPDPADWPFHLDLWQHATSVALHHHAPLWSDAHFEVLDRYYASLARLGQKAVTVIAAEMPWSGQRCFLDAHYPSYIYEHAIVDARRDRQGQLYLDTTKLERQLALAEKHGIAREIEVFGLLNIWVDENYGFGKVAPDAPDSIRVRCYDEATERITYLRTARELSAFIQLLADFFQRTGRMERVRITADEPSDVAIFNERMRFVQKAAPAFRFKIAINHYEFMGEADSAVLDWVPNLANAFRDPELTMKITRELRRKNGRMLWYICCGPPIPNTFLRSPLPEARLLGWLTQRLDLDGFLRWAFCLWPAKPYERISWRAPFWNAGDMHFVLPGADGAPVETLRYEALRAGIQDFVLLKMLQDKLGAARAQEVIDAAFARLLRVDSLTAFVGAPPERAAELYSLDPADYAAAHAMIVETLAAG